MAFDDAITFSNDSNSSTSTYLSTVYYLNICVYIYIYIYIHTILWCFTFANFKLVKFPIAIVTSTILHRTHPKVGAESWKKSAKVQSDSVNPHPTNSNDILSKYEYIIILKINHGGLHGFFVDEIYWRFCSQHVVKTWRRKINTRQTWDLSESPHPRSQARILFLQPVQFSRWTPNVGSQNH